MPREGGISVPSLATGAPWVVGLVAVAALATRAPAPAVPSTPSTPAAAAADASRDTAGQDLGAVVPIVKLIGDVANERLTPPDIVRSWQVVERYLNETRQKSPALYLAIQRLGELVHDGARGPADWPKDGQSAPMDVDTALALVAGFDAPARGEVDAQRKRLLDYLRATRSTSDYVHFAQEKVSRVADVQFVIVTVPDYVDSYSRWIADEALGSVQAAAGAAGYTLDRFHLPGWSSVSRETEGRTRRVHETEPGALIFRSRPAVTGAAMRLQLLVVLVVTETATRGLDKQSFAAASQLVLAWNPEGPATLKVLGPNFSGTSQSMRLAVEDALRDARRAAPARVVSVQIVTGSATSTVNHDILASERAFATPTAGRQVTFESAVHTDPDMLAAVESRLDVMGILPSQVALLVEENTGWGDALPTAGMSGSGTRSCQNSEKGTFSCALRISFPMHISRLATSSDSTKRSAAPAPGAPAPSLDLADAKEPADRLPSFTPALTEGSMATALAGVLSTLVREQVRAVGILATDKRDFVFLAREVIRAAPNVQLFTTEPHILFLHPDYRSFIRGTLVASSYSLFSRTQPDLDVQTPSGDGGLQRRRRQFITMATQGRYNALLHLLGKDGLLIEAAADAGASDDMMRLRPTALWLGIVGQNRFVPLEAQLTTGAPLLARPYLNLNGTWKALRIAFVLALLTHLGLIVAARFGRTPVFPSFFAPFKPASDPESVREQDMLTAAAVASLAFVSAWFLVLGHAIAEDRDISARFVAAPLLWATAIAGAVAAAALLAGGIRRAGDMRRAARQQPLAGRQRVTGVAVVLVFVGCLAAFTYGSVMWFLVTSPAASSAWYLVRSPVAGPELTALQLAAERTLDLGSFVSPSAIVLAIGVIGYTWAIWSLRCLRHQTYRFEATAPLMLTLTRNDRRLAAEVTGALSTTVHPTGRYFVLPLAAMVLVAPGMLQTYSVDGEAFAYAIIFGSGLGLLAATVEDAQAAWLGWTLKSMLERVRLHPIAEEISARGKDPLDWGISIEPKFGTARRLLRDRLAEVRQHLDRVPEAVIGRPEQAAVVYRGSEQRVEPTTSLLAPRMSMLSPAAASFARRAQVRANDLGWVEHWDCEVPDPDTPGARHDDAAHVAEATLPLFGTRLWQVAVTAANQLAPGLWRQFWSKGRRPGTLTLADAYFRSAERFVSLMAALVLRAVVARVVRGLSLALVLGGMLFLGHLLCTFPGREFWLMADLVALSAVAVVGTALLVALERDEILSGLWSTRPGRVGLESGLVLRIVAYAALPLLTIFATQFPEAAGSLTSWLEPVRQVLPQ